MMEIRKLYFIVISTIPVLISPTLSFGQTLKPHGMQLAQIQEVCADTMHLNPADAAYDICVRSLKQTLEGVTAAQSNRDTGTREASACANIGINPGSPAFGQCVGNLDQSEWDMTEAAAR